jgi:hypothetical protein
MSVYINQNELKIGMLVKGSQDRIMMVLPDRKGACMMGFVLAVDIKTGKVTQQNTGYLQRLKT